MFILKRSLGNILLGCIALSENVGASQTARRPFCFGW